MVELTRTELPSESRAVILVKAAPRVGITHGETVCCAGIDFERKWVRLFPVAFRTLDDAQKFSRWDIINYHWKLPHGDNRIESRRLEHRSLSIAGRLNEKSRQSFIARSVVTSCAAEAKAGRSLALLRPRDPVFRIEKKPLSEYEREIELFTKWHEQEKSSLFGQAANLVPYEPSPYFFKYEYSSDDGRRTGTCQDWEIEATFLRWRRQYGERDTLRRMEERFGMEYPRKGFVLAMGTHKAYPQWLINGIFRLDHGAEEVASAQETLF